MYELLTECNLKPWEVAKMDCTDIDAVLVLNQKKREIMKREMNKHG